MSESRYRFCKIFVKGIEAEAVKGTLTSLLDGEFKRHSMFLAGLVVEVRGNPDAAGTADSGDDFVWWPVLVELEAAAEGGERVMMATASRILQALWDAGHSAVAACDFEDELPWSGGIQRIHR
jgi:hypothetical protein